MNFSATMNLLARDKRVFSTRERSGMNNKRVIPINPPGRDTMSFQKIFTYVGIISIRNYTSSEDRKLT